MIPDRDDSQAARFAAADGVERGVMLLFALLGVLLVFGAVLFGMTQTDRLARSTGSTPAADRPAPQADAGIIE